MASLQHSQNRLTSCRIKFYTFTSEYFCSLCDYLSGVFYADILIAPLISHGLVSHARSRYQA